MMQHVTKYSAIIKGYIESACKMKKTKHNHEKAN